MVLDEVAMNSAQRCRYDRGVVKLEHEIMVDIDLGTDLYRHYAAEDWCRKQFGKRWTALAQTGRWASFWGGRNDPGRYRFCFAESRDAVFFALKWQ
jgi:hypothetical protein